jgi:hypothetical protein
MQSDLPIMHTVLPRVAPPRSGAWRHKNVQQKRQQTNKLWPGRTSRENAPQTGQLGGIRDAWRVVYGRGPEHFLEPSREAPTCYLWFQIHARILIPRTELRQQTIVGFSMMLLRNQSVGERAEVATPLFYSDFWRNTVSGVRACTADVVFVSRSCTWELGRFFGHNPSQTAPS